MSGLNEKSRDPSMEDVLASIRKIIAEELDAAHHAVVEDIGPLDHNLPWAEHQANGQARKTAPVLPVHSALVFEEAATDSTSIDLDGDAVTESVVTDAEAHSHAILVSESVVSDEQRAAVAEFEQVISALPVQDTAKADEAATESHDPLHEQTALDHSDDIAVAAIAHDPASSEHEVGEVATDWQSAPLPFEIASFAAPQPDRDALSVSDVEASTVAVPEKFQTALYSDFLEAQKPQLNVKLDLSFLQQKFHEQSPATDQVAQQDVVETAHPVSADPVLAAPDFSVFASDNRTVSLPPFIPANEPSYTSLVSQRTTEALLSSLRQLTEATRPQAPAAPQREQTLSPRLDEFMADILRPLLSQWLDTNLERIVDQAVREEIAKLTRTLRP